VPWNNPEPALQDRVIQVMKEYGDGDAGVVFDY